MKFKNILIVLTPCILALACKKQDIPVFNSEMSGIYFQSGLNMHSQTIADTYYDSTVFTFTAAPLNAIDTILRTRVATMGKVRDYPRPFKVFADPALSTAMEGKHFEIDHNSAIIPAGANEAYIHVKFNRTVDMLDNSFTLVLKLQDNDHFKVYMEKQRSSEIYGFGSDVYADRFKFIVSEIYSQPPSWNSYSSYWGKWTATKYKYINAVLGWTTYDWTTGWSTGTGPVSTGGMNPAALTVRNALQALADAGTPMLDEDGLGMQLGTNYLVVY